MNNHLTMKFHSIMHKPELLLAEFTTHGHMCDVFGSSKTAQYCVNDFHPWVDQDRLIKETESVIEFCKIREIKNILFITISPYFYIAENNLAVFRNTGISMSAILHADVPNEKSSINNLIIMSGLFENLFVYHNECISTYIDIPLKKYLKVIAHPPILLSSLLHYPRKKRNIKQRKVVLGFLGEIRPGKGILECFKMFSMLPVEIRNKFSCLFTGGSSIPGELDKIKEIAKEKNIETEFVSKEIQSYGQYKIISDAEFAEAFIRSDIIMLPYCSKPATDAFSGVFPDGIMAGSTFIATENSIMGRIITREKLGFTFSFEDSESFLTALNNSLEFLQGDDIVKNQTKFIDYYFNETIEDIAIRACLKSSKMQRV